MSGRQLLAVLGLAAGLLIGWFVTRSGGEDPASATFDLGELVPEQVSYIRIDRPTGGTIELEAEADGWTVNGYPASDSLVTATIAALESVGAVRLIARSPATHERLGLVEGSAVRVRIGPAGAPDADFLVGGSGRDGRFVRLPDSDEAYVVPGATLDALTGDEGTWRDYVIARVDTAGVDRILIRRRGEAATELRRTTGSARGTGGWTVNGADADTSVVRIYMNLLADLEATGFPADSFVFAADFEDPAAAVELHGGEDPGDTPRLSLLFARALDHPDVLVRRADAPIVYTIDPIRANMLTTGPERFLAR